MLEEATQGLNIDPDGIYVDVTFGGGGHSKAILNQVFYTFPIYFGLELETLCIYFGFPSREVLYYSYFPS